MATVRRSHPHQQRIYTKQDVRIYKIAVRFVFVCKYVTSFFCGWGDGGGKKAGTPGPYPSIRRSTPPPKQWLCWSTFPMHVTSRPLVLSYSFSSFLPRLLCPFCIYLIVFSRPNRISFLLVQLLACPAPSNRRSTRTTVQCSRESLFQAHNDKC